MRRKYKYTDTLFVFFNKMKEIMSSILITVVRKILKIDTGHKKLA